MYRTSEQNIPFSLQFMFYCAITISYLPCSGLSQHTLLSQHSLLSQTQWEEGPEAGRVVVTARAEEPALRKPEGEQCQVVATCL